MLGAKWHAEFREEKKAWLRKEIQNKAQKFLQMVGTEQ